jgi:hypothetical protein
MLTGNRAGRITAFDHELAADDDSVPSARLTVGVGIGRGVSEVVELEYERICIGACFDPALALPV